MERDDILRSVRTGKRENCYVPLSIIKSQITQYEKTHSHFNWLENPFKTIRFTLGVKSFNSMFALPIKRDIEIGKSY